MKFPDFVAFTLDRLEERGFSAYLVGGCVRDFIMGNSPNDYDITTNALPNEIEACFSDMKTLDVGKKHGTITLVFGGVNNIEVTTYRIDGEYKDSRHPESVTFTDRIEDDLARRDFTMNAIAYSPKRGFVDPFDGRTDIENGIIRCVGDPRVRFEEDALRIMRGLRFASRFGFDIEEETSLAIHEKKGLLLKIALERINTELKGMISEKNGSNVVSTYFDVFRTVIPSVSAIDYDALKRGAELNLSAAVCVFFSSVGDLKLLETELKRLKFDNNSVKGIVSVLSFVPEYYDKCDDADIKMAVSKIGKDATANLYRVLYCLSDDEKYLEAVERLNFFENNNICMTLKQLDIKGNEIIEKYSINPAITGKVLEKLLCDVIEDKIPNETAALLKQAKLYI